MNSITLRDPLARGLADRIFDLLLAQYALITFRICDRLLEYITVDFNNREIAGPAV